MPRLSEFKEIAKSTWASGDYDAMMRQEGLYVVGERLVRRLGVGAGDEVLDVACGTGNATIPAARAGARVTGLDLTPQMLATARRRAVGLDIDWVEGDAEDLPAPDERFDVVLSTFGCMFAPRHEVVADEIARVLRPGGRVGLCTWTPDGSIGDFFRTVGAYLPPLPEFVDPPLAWGDDDHVRELFEGTGITLEFHHETADIHHDSLDAAVDCYATKFGPVIQARTLADADGRWPDLRADMVELFARHNTSHDAQIVVPAEYLVVVGRKAR
ncbi:Ubiquinone/menaquinone biosynthesis methyltransferase UbiE [Alloactinosynnema sp. L-07]|uniref:class I SAM-dependent methyltransferase n=1 Tax=Alloactinosynnema sp. L-07 TaxID=1653480 RepID=UPI00065F03D2|nr:class I SAM-dependent methyltransferase [Alloactinosynnema sp. L-07]CRK55016.1 Ubiquinone/menaquinone biosynthesis methyltransferase UbiE [Alloactinosynnema sp. L-07]